MKRVNADITASLEDYLEAIYFIDSQGGDVRITDIADELKISKPSVNRAINTLKAQGYVEHEHYGSLKLTETGLEIAKSVAKKHMMLKRFLKDVLKVDEKSAEQEACLVEHCLSQDTINKFSNFMDNFLDD